MAFRCHGIVHSVTGSVITVYTITLSQVRQPLSLSLSLSSLPPGRVVAAGAAHFGRLERTAGTVLTCARSGSYLGVRHFNVMQPIPACLAPEGAEAVHGGCW